MIAPPHVYGDFNAGCVSPRNPALSAVPLDRFGSLRDLSNAGIRLRDGVRLSIYADSDENEDIQATTDVYFDAASGRWYAEFDWADIRDVPRHDGSMGDRFRCVHCAADLPVGLHGRPTVEVCSFCQTSVGATIAPPDQRD